MNDRRSRRGALLSLTAAAGAFGAGAILWTTTAPNARADVYTDMINAVNGDFAAGQSNFEYADKLFSAGEFGPALTPFFAGVDEDLVAAPQNLVVGSVDALTNEPFGQAVNLFELSTPTNFADAVTLAENQITLGETYLSAVPSLLSEGLYGNATFDGLLGTDLTTLIPLEELLLGAATSF